MLDADEWIYHPADPTFLIVPGGEIAYCLTCGTRHLPRTECSKTARFVIMPEAFKPGYYSVWDNSLSKTVKNIDIFYACALYAELIRSATGCDFAGKTII